MATIVFLPSLVATYRLLISTTPGTVGGAGHGFETRTVIGQSKIGSLALIGRRREAGNGDVICGSVMIEV